MHPLLLLEYTSVSANKPNTLDQPYNFDSLSGLKKMAGEWSGFEDGDLRLDFAGEIFDVHRAVIAEASPVWKAILTGFFTESAGSTIQLVDDDPQVARLCIELICSTFANTDLDWTSIGSRVKSDHAAFNAFVDKYDLRGVKRLVAHELEIEKDKQQLKGAEKAEKQRGDRLEQKYQWSVTKPGNLVNIYEYRPPIGTRVKWHTRLSGIPGTGRVGTVISNDNDGGSEIGVLWSDSVKQHNLKCGKKNTWHLEYA